MTTPDTEQLETHHEEADKIERQIAFVSGLFQKDSTIRTLLEALAEGVVVIDNTGTILLVNIRAAQMFGYPLQELAGKPLTILIPERFRKIHKEHEARFFADPKIRKMGEQLNLTGLRRDGTEIPVEISLGFVETINGILVLALVSDISERREAQEQREQLVQRLSERTAELEAANRNLESFSYTIANDLLKSLMSIGDTAKKIEQIICVKEDETCKANTEKIYLKTRHLAEVISTMHDFFRPTRSEFHEEIIDLSSIAAAVAEKLRRKKSERQVTFRITDGVMVTGDRTMLQVVLEHLLENAWKHTSKREEGIIEFGVAGISGQISLFRP